MFILLKSSYDSENAKTITILSATDFSIPVTASNGVNIQGNVNATNFVGDVNANLVSSPVVSFTNNIDKDITTESGSHAVTMGDITIDSGSSTNIGGTWDILDSYFFTQASNKQIYGLLFDFDGAITLSVLIGQNLWKNNFYC